MPAPLPPRTKLIVALAVTLAVLSAIFPVLGLPAFIVVVLAIVIAEGRWRVFAVVVGGLGALAGFTRFALEYAAPNIVLAGQKAGEEKAVSRLREILWAQKQAKSLGLSDADRDGVTEYVPLDRLVQEDVPLLRRDLYLPVSPGVFAVEGYLVAVWLPGLGSEASDGSTPIDAARAANHWIGYAWPAVARQAGNRAFFIDQDERICETANTQGYVGPAHRPRAFAALDAPTFEAAACAGTDQGSWRPWKKKQPRGR